MQNKFSSILCPHSMQIFFFRSDISAKSNKKMRNKRSQIWMHFTPGENDKAKCDHCGHELSYRGSTSNLRKHYDAKHGTMGPLELKRPRIATPAKPVFDVTEEPEKQSETSTSSSAQNPQSDVGTSHNPTRKRVFSKSGQLISDRRNRLKAKHVQMVMFLNANL